MATFTLGDDYATYFIEYYAQLEATVKTSKRVEMADPSGNTIVYIGTNIVVEGGILARGTVTKVQFIGAEGDDWFTISDLAFNPKDLPQTSVAAGFTFYEKGNDTYIGTDADDRFASRSNPGNDKVFGMGGDDYMFGSDGNNTFKGGAGSADVLAYSSAAYATKPGNGAVKVDLSKGTVVNPWGKTDTISGIEGVTGTAMADRFIGGKGNESFYGYAGNDIYSGGKGDDVFALNRGMGRDKITDFGNGDDTLVISFPGFDAFDDIFPRISVDEKNTVIDFGNGDLMTLLDFKDIAETDFVFRTGDA